MSTDTTYEVVEDEDGRYTIQTNDGWGIGHWFALERFAQAACRALNKLSELDSLQAEADRRAEVARREAEQHRLETISASPVFAGFSEQARETIARNADVGRLISEEQRQRLGQVELCGYCWQPVDTEDGCGCDRAQAAAFTGAELQAELDAQQLDLIQRRYGVDRLDEDPRLLEATQEIARLSRSSAVTCTLPACEPGALFTGDPWPDSIRVRYSGPGQMCATIEVEGDPAELADFVERGWGPEEARRLFG
jgi:hypothetical protein